MQRVFLILLLGHLNGLKAKPINVLELLDVISDSIDYFLINFTLWDEDLQFVLKLIESSSKALLDQYIRSKIDFDSKYIPILRRLNGQSNVFARKITNYLHKNYKALNNPYSRLYDVAFFPDYYLTHAITNQTFLWMQKSAVINSNDIYFQKCISMLFEIPLDSCNDLYGFGTLSNNQPQNLNCFEIMTHFYNVGDAKIIHKIIYAQIYYTLLINQFGCGHQFNMYLVGQRKSLIIWQSELCTNALTFIRKSKIGNQLVYQNADVLTTVAICLYLGYMDFLDHDLIDDIMGRSLTPNSQLFNSLAHRNGGNIPLESHGCFVMNNVLQNNAEGPPHFVGNNNNNNLNIKHTQTPYIPFQHPLAFDFENIDNIPNYALLHNSPPKQPLRNSRINDHSLCDLDGKFSKAALGVAMTTLLFLLNPGPDTLSAYRLDPETYQIGTLRWEEYRTKPKKEDSSQQNIVGITQDESIFLPLKPDLDIDGQGQAPFLGEDRLHHGQHYLPNSQQSFFLPPTTSLKHSTNLNNDDKFLLILLRLFIWISGLFIVLNAIFIAICLVFGGGRRKLVSCYVRFYRCCFCSNNYNQSNLGSIWTNIALRLKRCAYVFFPWATNYRKIKEISRKTAKYNVVVNHNL